MFTTVSSARIWVKPKENFQIAIITENMVPDIVYQLYSENLDIKLQCSLAIFKCASNKVGIVYTFARMLSDSVW